MPKDADDRQRQPDEHFLPAGTLWQELPDGAVFERRPFRAHSELWEHDYCELCSAQFMDPQFSAVHAKFVSEHPALLTEGYVATVGASRLEHWVCHPCFEHAATERGWIVEAA